MIKGQRMLLRRAMSSARVDKFYLPTPSIPSAYDPYFQALLRRLGPSLARNEGLTRELHALGMRCASNGDIARLGFQAEVWSG
jgi:hypothetical protein